jgi:hypothetical protein
MSLLHTVSQLCKINIKILCSGTKKATCGVTSNFILSNDLQKQFKILLNVCTTTECFEQLFHIQKLFCME